jgi:hypothetical protein
MRGVANRHGRRMSDRACPSVGDRNRLPTVSKALASHPLVWYNHPTMSARSRTIYVYRGYAYAWRFS